MLSPYDSEDARGLLKAAIRDPDPVVFLENELLYGQAFPVTAEVGTKGWRLAARAVQVYPLLSLACSRGSARTLLCSACASMLAAAALR